MPRPRCRLLWPLVVALICLPSIVFADERINLFDSKVTIASDGVLTVTETITVSAAGEKIRRGIYRDFPTRYKDLSGGTKHVGFDLLQVTRDQKPEPHHLESLSNGVRVYVGHKDRFLAPGRYTYELTYRTDRQIGFFEQHDELYWNVTGTDWDFPIEQVSATVHLPDGVFSHQTQVSAYTGVQGAAGRDYESDTGVANEVRFRTTRALSPGSGLTIVVGWPKGFIVEPTASERFGYVIQDNIVFFVGFIGILVVVLYFLYAWNRVGRDPLGRSIFPRFEPPKDLSPAASRYIMKMGFDSRVLSTALISIAVKRCIKIYEDDLGGKTFIERDDEGEESGLSLGEKVLFKKLLGKEKTLKLENANHKKIKAAQDQFKLSLEGEYHKHFFVKNGRWLIPGLALSGLVLLAVTAVSDEPGLLFAFVVPIFMVFAFLFTARSIWKQGRRVLAVTLGAGTALTGFTNLTFAFFTGQNFAVILLLVFLIAINFLFYFLLRAPTRAGRDVMDEIEGFKKFLSTTEKNRLKTLESIDRQLLLYEKYLPYALALDVGQEWSEKFSDALAQAAHDPNEHYQPSWYHGRSWNTRNPVGFANNLGSTLSSTVVAAGTAPGSSSGFSGGSSGGGGGGGGGGGW